MKTQGEHIRTLRRRVDFLKTRDYKNSYDQAELGALEWALVNLPPAQRNPPQFPTMLRKMWSGAEVQKWIKENWEQT